MAADYSQIFGDPSWMDAFNGTTQQNLASNPPASPDFSRVTDPYWKWMNPQQQQALTARYKTPEEVDAYLQAQRAATEKVSGPGSYDAAFADTSTNTYGTPSQGYTATGTPTGSPMSDGNPYPAGTPSTPDTAGSPSNISATINGTNTPGSMQSLLDQLTQRYNDLVKQQDQTIADYKSKFDPALAAILARSNTAEGFSPEALSALRSQETSGIPKQYEDAARQARIDLLRTGAIGAGELPGSPADVLRTMAPLDQARADAVAGATRDTILKNEAEKKRTLDLNRAAGQTALDQLTGSTKTISDIQNPLGYAAAATQQQGANNALDIAKLQADTQKTIANLDADTQKWMGTLSSDTQKALAQLSATTQTNLGNLDAQTRIRVAELDNAPGSYKQILLTSLLSGAMAPGADGKPSLISQGLGGLIDILTGKPNDAAAAAVEAALGKGAQGPLEGGAPPTSGSGIGTTIGKFLKDPITLGVGGVLAAGALWLKSQAHWEANTMVQQFENPFHDNYLTPFVDEFTKAYSSGQMTKQQAQDMRSAFVQNWNDYVSKAREFGKKGSDEKTVSDQSIMNLWNVAIQPILGTIDKAIGSLA